ncbi:aminoglycoside phosphotransferase family protein [Kocuria sp. M4R2S49]|uniref:aminoglycoside phosphotransferase family protein n=1 Tax=Kocuria rhizosphaericola TaxID=3376284 RepID=UPI003798A934
MAGPEQVAVALLTGSGMGPVLADALRPAGLSVQRWTRRRVHHRPGAGVTAVYDVVALAGARRAAEVVCVGTAAPPERSSTAAVRIRHEGVELVAWRHPHDPWLPGLPWACSPEAVGREVFSSAVAAELTEVSYRPTRRAVLRTDHGSQVRYLKVLRHDRAAALHARHRMLLEAGLPVPAPDGDPVRDVVVLRRLPGAPLAASVRDDSAAALRPEHVLALLDALPAAALELPARASWTDRVLDYGHAAAVALPEERARIERLAAAIDGARRATDPGPTVPAHGDLYEANLLVGPDARGGFGPVTGLLDVDTVGPGHRVDDLACLVAHLSVLPTVHDRYAHAPAAAERLLAGFDEVVDPAALRVRCAGVALSLVAGARRSGGPPHRARRRLEIAERFLVSAQQQGSEAESRSGAAT